MQMFAAVLTIVLASQVLLIECGNVDTAPGNQVESTNGEKLKELLREYLVQQQMNEEAELMPALIETKDEQGNEENDESGENEKRSPYLRFGKRNPAYLRFGRSYLRFGKRAPSSYLRFGKRNPAYLRFGRSVQAN